MKVYLSSTFVDLQDHREKLAKALRKAKYDVVMMEEYVARDGAPCRDRLSRGRDRL